MTHTSIPVLTAKELNLLKTLHISSDGNGHDFGFIEAGKTLFPSPATLGGVVSSLSKKGLIVVHEPVTTDSGTWTQFTFPDLNLVAVLIADPAPAAPEADLPAAATKGIPESKVNAEALTLLESLKAEAVEKKITATSALKQVLDLFPSISRVQFKHTAALVGINPLTARNTFDRFHA